MADVSKQKGMSASIRPVIARVWRFIVKHKYPIALVVINLIVFHDWFFRFSYLTYWDWPQPITLSSKGLLTVPYIWSTVHSSLGGLNAFPSFYPIYALEGLLANMGFGFPVIERVLYMWPAVIVGSLGSYYLCRRILKSELAAFVGSIIFVFNTYALRLTLVGHFNILAAFAFAPFVLLFFIKTMDEKKYHYAVAAGLLSCVAGFYDLRIFYIIAIAMVLYAFYHTLFMEKPAIKGALRNALLTLVPMALVLLTNMYWLLGYYAGGGFSSSPVFTSVISDAGLSLRHAVALHDSLWTGSNKFMITSSIPWYFYLIPVLALLGLVLGRKNRNVVFFGILALIGIMLTKQMGGPFSGLYPWLFNHLPGFRMFREASKFYLLICLGYAVLVASLVKWLGERLTRSTWEKAAKYTVVVLVLFLFLINAASIVTGDWMLCIPRKMPNDNRILNEFISEQNSDFRTLWIPMCSRWGDQTERNPMLNCWNIMFSYFAVCPSINTSWERFVGTIKTTAANPINEIYTGLIAKPYFGELLSDAAVKYVIVPVRDVKNDDDFFSYYSIERDDIVKALDKAESLERIDIGTKELAVYENKDFKPYMDSEDNVFRIDTLAGLDEKYRFAVNVLKDRFAFVEGKDASSASLTMLHNLFDPSGQTEVSISGAAITDKVDVDLGARNNNVFENMDRRTVGYEAGGGRLFLNGELLNVKLTETSVIASYRATGGGGFGSVNAPLKPGMNTFEFRDPVYTFSNLVPNGSFEQGPWNEKVLDFHNYDKNPVLGMRVAEGRSEGTKSIQLEAARHIAATAQNGIPVNPGSSYLFSIDYQSPNGGNGEYIVSFNPGGTQTKETLTTSDDKWHTAGSLLRPPEGTTSLNLALLCSPKADGQRAIVRYDNIRLIETPDFLDYYYLVSAPGEGFETPGGIEFESVNPTRKVVHVKSASTSFFLSMSESYHTRWRATVTSKGKESFTIPEREHLKLDDVSNAWFVDLSEVRKKGLVRENGNGTYDLDMTIEFTPQRYTYAGFAISLITLLAAIAYLVLDWRRRRCGDRAARLGSPGG